MTKITKEDEKKEVNEFDECYKKLVECKKKYDELYDEKWKCYKIFVKNLLMILVIYLRRVKEYIWNTFSRFIFYLMNSDVKILKYCMAILGVILLLYLLFPTIVNLLSDFIYIIGSFTYFIISGSLPRSLCINYNKELDTCISQCNMLYKPLDCGLHQQNVFGRCLCDYGWEGKNCSEPICKHKCGSRQKCVSPNFCACIENSHYIYDECICDVGWEGENCDKPKCNLKCGKHQHCIFAPSVFTFIFGDDMLCACDEGWKGEKCEEIDYDSSCYKNKSPCKEKPSAEPARDFPNFKDPNYHCDFPEFGSFEKCGKNQHFSILLDKCFCDDGWGGEKCDKPECDEHQHYDYLWERCVCDKGYVAEGWKGENCVIEKCKEHQHHDQLFGCVCDKGWSGKNCDTPRCWNTRQHYNKYLGCICNDGWTGKDCEIGICDPMCKDHEICNEKRECVCDKGWSGKNCEIPICKQECGKHQHCNEKRECVCNEGWSGKNCEIPICDPPCSYNQFCNTYHKCQFINMF